MVDILLIYFAFIFDYNIAINLIILRITSFSDNTKPISKERCNPKYVAIDLDVIILLSNYKE